MDETPDERAKRRRQRLLFDGIAEDYDAVRQGYAHEVVDLLFDTTELVSRDPVLEVGCGSGQLTMALAQRGVAVTAIDIGASMVELAARRVSGFDVKFQASAYENLEAPDGAFAAVVSGTAFHWIDPEVAWRKSAALLRPAGWIAILGTSERYDDPFGAEFREQWIRYSDDGGAWATTPKPTLPEIIASTGLFEPAVTHRHLARRTMHADAVVALEQTRATTLSFSDSTRSAFVDDLRRLLGTIDVVPLTQETTVTMARLISS